MIYSPGLREKRELSVESIENLFFKQMRDFTLKSIVHEAKKNES